MAFKLDKAEIKRRDELIEQLGKAQAALEDAISSFNEKLSDLRDGLIEKVNDYNEALADAQSWIEDVKADREGEYEDKSERWQEGEKGQAARAWLDEYEAFELTEVELDLPGDIEEPDLSHADELSGLSEEAA